MVAIEAIRSANKAFKETPEAKGLVGLFGRSKPLIYFEFI